MTEENNLNLNRRKFVGVAAGSAATAGVLGASAGGALFAAEFADAKKKKKKKKKKKNKLRRVPVSRIGMQVYTMRNMISQSGYANQQDGFKACCEALADGGYKTIEVGGSYYGNSAAEFRAVAEGFGLRVVGSHVPGGASAFRSNLNGLLDDAEALGLPHIGIASPHSDYTSGGRTVAKYEAMAEEFNQLGAATAARGIKFYYHNHPDDHTLDNGTDIYQVLLDSTDPSIVFFELDIAWSVAGGQNPKKYLNGRVNRFPLFHVKDLRWDEAGNRTTPANVNNPGRKFFLTPVGKGDINFANLFRLLPNLNKHQFLVEEDDAGNIGSTYPPGPVNSAWVSRRTLYQMEVRKPKK